MVIRGRLWICAFFLLEVRAEQHDYGSSYPVFQGSNSNYGMGTSTTDGYQTSVITSISTFSVSTSLTYNSSDTTRTVRSEHTSPTPVFESTRQPLPSSSGNKPTSSLGKSQSTRQMSSTVSTQATGSSANSRGSLTSLGTTPTGSASSLGSTVTSAISTAPSTASSQSSVTSTPDSSGSISFVHTKGSSIIPTTQNASTTSIDSKNATQSIASTDNSSRASISSSLVNSQSRVTGVVTSSVISTKEVVNSTWPKSTNGPHSGSFTFSSQNGTMKSSSALVSESLTTNSTKPSSALQSTSSWGGSQVTSWTASSSQGTSTGTTSGTIKPSPGESSSHGGSKWSSSSAEASSSKGDSSSQGTLSTIDSSAPLTNGSHTSSVQDSSAQETSSSGLWTKSRSSGAEITSTATTTSVTARPTPTSITAPPTSTFNSAVSTISSSTSTSGSILIGILQKEIKDDTSELKNLVVLIGAWIKSPKPNPSDIISSIDTIVPALNSLKPKLPQPPPNDPECKKGNRGLQKRFWPFDGIKDVVNAVQAVAQVVLKVSKLRTQIVEGVIDGVQSELFDVGKITDALDKYDVAKDPCNAPQTTFLSSGFATTTSSSSACSTRTISNCNVLCTLTTTIGQVQTLGLGGRACSTICDPPKVTCGGATTWISTSLTTVVPQPLCAPTCCRPGPTSAPSSLPPMPVPLDTQGIQKRTPLPSPHGAPFNGIFNFMKDICNSYSTLVQIVDGSGKITLGYQTRLDQRKSICMGCLTGCTAVIVMSDNYPWMAHIFESPTIVQQDRWQEDVFDAFESGGHNSNIPEDQSLRNLVRVGGPFGPGTRTRAYIVAPLVRRDTANDPQSNQWLYPEFLGRLQYFMERIIGNDVHLTPYMATADLEWGIVNVPPTDPEYRPRWNDALTPFLTPFGKVIINFDPNRNNAPGGCWGKAGWEIWVSVGPEPVAMDEWDSYNHPQPGKRAETSAAACPRLSTSSTISSSIGKISKSSAGSTTTKSSITGSGSTWGTSAISATMSTGSSVQSPTSSVPQSTISSALSSGFFSSDRASKSTSTVSSTSSSRSTQSGSTTPNPTTPPELSVPPSSDDNCNGCGNWWKACETEWCPKVHLSGEECSNKCFVHACFAESSPPECHPGGRCHTLTCPDSPNEPRKTVPDSDTLNVNCNNDTGCKCCSDYTDLCLKNWVPKDTPKIRAYDFCFSEMCYDAPRRCRKGSHVCKLTKDCPNKKGEPKLGGWPGISPVAMFNPGEIQEMAVLEFGSGTSHLNISN